MKMDHLRRKTMFPFGKVICLCSCRQHTKFSYHVARAIAIIKTIRFDSLVVLAVSCPKKRRPNSPSIRQSNDSQNRSAYYYYYSSMSTCMAEGLQMRFRFQLLSLEYYDYDTRH